MLEIKNLVKVYKAKGGAEVRALDNVSVRFEEKGMVFLLGKSGSGPFTRSTPSSPPTLTW